MRVIRGSCSLGIAFSLVMVLSGAVLAREYSLTILHTNDHHGHFQKFSPYPVKDVGGLAAQSALVSFVRAEVESAGGHTLVLSAGDVNTGVPESDLVDAEPDITLMNMIGYDAMTLGNHEFDNPLEVLQKQRSLAKFPFLAANVIRKNTGELLVDPYVIKEIDGLKVAILGLITEEVPTLVMPANVAELHFQAVIETAAKYVPELRKQADLVVALTHIGFYGEESRKSGDVQLAKAVPGIDVIVGGHTHTALKEPVVVGTTLIVQAGAYSEYVGRLNLTVDSGADRVSNSSYELLPVNGKKRITYNDKHYYRYVGTGYVEDDEILAASQPFLEQASDLLNQPLGTAAVELVGGKNSSRSQETNLGNLIADAMRQKSGADIALLNGGGIRAGIAPGRITYRDILTVQPFGNTLTEIMMTGSQIMAVLDLSAASIGGGGFLQVSGLKMTCNRATGKADKVMVGDAPIDPGKTYKVVTSNFVATGGDGYAMLKDLPQYDTGYVDADTTMDYIRQKGEVNPQVEGRITVVP